MGLEWNLLTSWVFRFVYRDSHLEHFSKCERESGVFKTRSQSIPKKTSRNKSIA